MNTALVHDRMLVRLVNTALVRDRMLVRPALCNLIQVATAAVSSRVHAQKTSISQGSSSSSSSHRLLLLLLWCSVGLRGLSYFVVVAVIKCLADPTSEEEFISDHSNSPSWW